MKIVAKSILIKEQILDKVNKGCDALEIQLAEELYTSPPPHNINDLFDNDLLNITDIYSVHLPLGKHRFDTNLDDVFSSDRIFAFYDGCSIAQKSAKIWNHPVRLILHFEMDFDKMIRADYITDHIITVFRNALNDYPDVIFAIENVIPLLPKQNGWYLSSNGFDDCVRLVEYLRTQLNTKRFSVVLDTCHAGMTIYYLDVLYSLLNQAHDKYAMEDFFKAYSEYCDTIHLCTFKEDGFYKNHGIGFQDNHKLLEEYVDLWNKYTKNAALVLEVREDDYTNSINFYENSLLIKEYLEV
ncbi:MAG: hypothetical protein JJE03_00730 [Peptostreptococcaceae bacterium]|nr:hypothetical protein [Peptostreptococcaceae bacterium]